ncbi:MAG: hypothetical protein WBP29_04565, partial [Candidatus Zixiibacteriota bacterium]
MIGTKRLCLAVAIAACQIVAPSAASAATYYVRTNGNDASNGTSWATAWKTVAKVNSSIVAGDEVRFGTGRWLGTSLLPPTGGNASNVTVYA